MILCAKFGWNWPSGSGEEDENVKSLQTDGKADGQTDVDEKWSEKLTCSGELNKKPMGHIAHLRNTVPHKKEAWANSWDL